jgi:hypothetical protein
VKREIISLKSIDQLAFVMDMCGVFLAVSIILVSYGSKVLIFIRSNRFYLTLYGLGSIVSDDRYPVSKS